VYEAGHDDSEKVINLLVKNTSGRARGKIMSLADKLRAEGRKEGIQIGIEQGIEQGMVQGIEQGFAKGERQAFLSIAQKMKAKRLSESEIANLLGISLENLYDLLELIDEQS